MSISKLNKIFNENDILTATNMNDVCEKVDELVDNANTNVEGGGIYNKNIKW